MRVMLDTNVFVSVIFFPSDNTREFVKTLASNHQIIICDYVIKELELVVERKFPSKIKDLELFIKELPFELVNTPQGADIKNIPSIRDANDVPILAAAITENVDIFITGDKDFLVLDIKKPKIISMRDFVRN